ncbi:MAG: TolC family protein [Bacteroidetes bacterium]|nr:TolC family protein [Bacteroidota bacterium]
MTLSNLSPAGLMVVVLLCCSFLLNAQDTVRISLPEAEKQFINNNLQLLAEHYNISIAKAEKLQAGLYNNPNISYTGIIYNPDNRKLFDISNNSGEYIFNIQQIISLAGKRNKAIKLAETNIRISENRFFDLLRTLRYSLRTNFYTIYYLQHSIQAYLEQINALEKLSTGYDELRLTGTVSTKDALRIKSLYYSLLSEKNSIQNQLNDAESEIRLLLHNNKSYFIPDIPDEFLRDDAIRNMNIQSLIDTAFLCRQDLHLAENNLNYNQQNYLLQKAMAVPDITLGSQFDKRGSFVNNASFFSMGIDLPFFNRNQGNIRSAKLTLEQSNVQLQLQKEIIENEVQLAWQKIASADKMLNAIDTGFTASYKNVMQSVLENFQKKNLTLLEFIDFSESYRNSILQLNQLQNDRMQAIEALHFAIGKTIINN